MEKETQLEPNEYRCAECGEVFVKGWSDAEATAERETLFPCVAEDDCALVCDDCFKAMGLA